MGDTAREEAPWYHVCVSPRVSPNEQQSCLTEDIERTVVSCEASESYSIIRRDNSHVGHLRIANITWVEYMRIAGDYYEKRYPTGMTIVDEQNPGEPCTALYSRRQHGGT